MWDESRKEFYAMKVESILVKRPSLFEYEYETMTILNKAHASVSTHVLYLISIYELYVINVSYGSNSVRRDATARQEPPREFLEHAFKCFFICFLMFFSKMLFLLKQWKSRVNIKRNFYS